MAEIRLFVCCHEPSCVPKHPLLVPLQVGTALAERRFAGFAHDDEGENISRLNRSYCELTAQYWAWKNVQADYLGFFHYRRYLYPDERAKRPYRVEREPSEALLAKRGYGRFEALIPRYDIIVPKPEDMRVSVRAHYAGAPYHRIEDLRLAEEILRARHPKMTLAAEKYLSGTAQRFGNIYIMRREVFEDYCAWLFPLLAEFDERANTSDCTPQEKRVDGYLAERLLGVYAAYRGERGDARIGELPKLHFCGKAYPRTRALNALLPPGTRRRAAVKRAVRSLREV